MNRTLATIAVLIASLALLTGCQNDYQTDPSVQAAVVVAP